MKLFNLSWFSSKERGDLLVKRIKEETQAMISEGNQRIEDFKKEQAAFVPNENIYSKILVSNGFTTLILKDGTVITKQDSDGGLIPLLKGAKTEEELIQIMSAIKHTEIQQDNKDFEVVKEAFYVLKNHPDFEIVGENAYLKGVKLALPAVVAASFIEAVEKDNKEAFDALKMFWLKLALNSLEQSRQDTLTFVKKNDVKITPNGNLVMYRRIVSLEKETLAENSFISTEYFRIKAKKKGPANYLVIKDIMGNVKTIAPNEQIPDNVELMGNLKYLYTGLPEKESNKFTSKHNQGVLTIKLGSIYKIPENEINLDNGICAGGGLHAAAVDYNYEGFGDTPVVVLVNPSKAITVPRNETGKLRTTEMFVACVNDKPHGVHFDDNTIAAFDEEYHDLTLAELETVVSSKDFSSISVQNEVPDVTLVDVKNITEMLKSRVTTF